MVTVSIFGNSAWPVAKLHRQWQYLIKSKELMMHNFGYNTYYINFYCDLIEYIVVHDGFFDKRKQLDERELAFCFCCHRAHVLNPKITYARISLMCGI